MIANTFAVADLLLGLDVERVVEVVSDTPCVPVPLAHPAVAGVINLRGRVVTVFDARLRLGLHAPRTGERVHVVVRRDESVAGLLVDRVLDVVDLSPDSVAELPDTVSGWIRSLTVSAHHTADGLLLVLDPDALTDVLVNPRDGS